MSHQLILIMSLVLTLCATGAAQTPSSTVDEIRKHGENARLALARNDLASAEREYRDILRLDPTNVDAHIALGVALYGSGKFADAVTTLSKAVELGGGQPRTELFLGMSESNLGHCDKAAPVLAEYFPQEPDLKLRRLAGLALLDCQLSASNPTPALETVQKLRDSAPDDPDVLYKSAALYTRMWSQAADELMQKHPESYRVHQLAGEVFEAQQRNEQAIKEFRMALEENPHAPELHFRIGQLILRQTPDGSENEALAEFQRELAFNPASAAAEYEIGEIYRNRQDSQQANGHFRRAIGLDPEFAEPHVGLAQVLLAQHSYKQARTELETAIRLQPDNATAHYNLMIVYRSEGNGDEASREMAVFQRLQEQDSQRFQHRLHSLLTGTSESAGHEK